MQLTQHHKEGHGWAVLVTEYRRSLNLSRKDFGLRYGVLRQTVFYWEKGKNEPPGQLTWDIMAWAVEGENE